jgi:ATP/ADP translocase
MSNSTILNNDTGTKVIVYICIHLVMPCAVGIGIIGNLLSILVFARREMIKFCVSIFTIVLALSDILLLTTSLFNIIIPDFRDRLLLSDKSAFWWYVMIIIDFIFIHNQLVFSKIRPKPFFASDKFYTLRAVDLKLDHN